MTLATQTMPAEAAMHDTGMVTLVRRPLFSPQALPEPPGRIELQLENSE